MSLLLSEAHISGGIVSIYDNCSQPTIQEFSLDETTLKQGLDYVAGIAHQRTWVHKNGIILVGSELANRTPLSVVIKDFDIDPKESLSLTAQRLLGTPEARSYIQTLGLTELTPELGFAQIRKTPAGNPTEAPVLPIKHLHKVMLVDALNVAATMKGTSVWEYEQFKCGNKSSFKLTWISK